MTLSSDSIVAAKHWQKFSMPSQVSWSSLMSETYKKRSAIWRWNLQCPAHTCSEKLLEEKTTSRKVAVKTDAT